MSALNTFEHDNYISDAITPTAHEYSRTILMLFEQPKLCDKYSEHFAEKRNKSNMAVSQQYISPLFPISKFPLYKIFHFSVSTMRSKI
jgi:regulator of PEP synthase PpsR (kinase-PPPase family)